MTEEELKKQLYMTLATLSTHARCIEAGIQEDNEAELIEAAAKTIKDLYKQAGYVQLDEDQSLPYSLNHPSWEYDAALADMLKANFKKVKSD